MNELKIRTGRRPLLGEGRKIWPHEFRTIFPSKKLCMIIYVYCYGQKWIIENERRPRKQKHSRRSCVFLIVHFFENAIVNFSISRIIIAWGSPRPLCVCVCLILLKKMSYYSKRCTGKLKSCPFFANRPTRVRADEITVKKKKVRFFKTL